MTYMLKSHLAGWGLKSRAPNNSFKKSTVNEAHIYLLLLSELFRVETRSKGFQLLNELQLLIVTTAKEIQSSHLLW